MSEPKKNWKDDLPLSKKIPDMPKNSEWKKGLNKFAIVDNREKPIKEKKAPKPLKRTPLPKQTKPINQIGARKKRRISEHGTETVFYLNVWITRGGFKQVILCACGCKQPIKDPFIWNEEKQEWKLIKPQCFAHILAKGQYEKFRYLAENIDIVATMKCHHENDKKYTGVEKRRELEERFDLLLEKISTGES